MHLIAAIASGIAGAENGMARVFVRGTTRRARYSFDFEGTSSYTADVGLDENGGASVYVDQAVDVVAYDSTGQAVREFSDSSTDGCVEVISSGFTGVDYETLEGGAGKPTTLRAVFDRLFTSFGATDFNVLMPDGTTKTLVQALSAVAGVFYNVKSPLYGATGDAITDDSTAIQAAITAAEAAGGGTVFFPAGTYNIEAAQITVPATVSLLGAGAAASLIRTNNTSSYAWVFEGGGNGIRSVTGIKFYGNSTSVYRMFEFTTGARVSMRSCAFAFNSTTYDGIRVDTWDGVSVRTQVSFEDCDFAPNGGGYCLHTSLNPRAGRVDFRRCRFTLGSSFSATSVVIGSCTHFYGCTFDGSSVTSGTITYVRCALLNGMYGSVRCCEFLDSGGATAYAMAIVDLDSSDEAFTEDGNIFQGDATNLTPYNFVSYGTTPGYYCKLGSRESRMKQMSLATTTVALTQVAQYGVISVRSTGAGNFTLTADSQMPLGQRLRVVFVNGSGVSRTLSMGTNMKGGSFTLSNNEAIGLEFVLARANNGTSEVASWFLVSTSGALTTGADSSYSV